jgi:4-hydroxy-4-methyl-2-oxoglutarate aldolase
MSLFEMNANFERPSEDFIAEFIQVPTTALSDAMVNLHTMDSGIHMMVPGHRLCGTAVTVATRAGDFLPILKGLELARKGDVLVIDNQSHSDTACWGEIVSTEAKVKGMQGVVVDGLVRDIEGIRSLGFSVFARGTVPRVSGRDNLGEVNVVVQCGGVAVTPGDIVVGDEDGIVVVPARKAREVLHNARAVLEFEEEFIKKIKAGKSQVELFELDQLIKDRLKELAKKWA